MSPSGGTRPGSGRKRQHPEGQPRPRRTTSNAISLYPDEWEQFNKLLQALGSEDKPLPRSEFVRRAIRAGWVLQLTDAQLEVLRVIVESPELAGALRKLAEGSKGPGD